MAKKKTTRRLPAPDPNDVFGQCLVAFGQGAGTTNVTARAVAAIRDEYLPDAGMIADWPEDIFVVLDYSRSLGRIAAHLATAEGRVAIDVAQWRQALRLIRRIRPPFVRCPWTP